MQEVIGSNPIFSTLDLKVHAIYDILYSKSVKTLKTNERESLRILVNISNA